MYSTISNKEGNPNIKNLNFIHPIPKHEMFWNRVLSCCLIFSGGKINEENGTQRLINFRSGWVCWETTEPNRINKTITAQSTRISVCICVRVCVCVCVPLFWMHWIFVWWENSYIVQGQIQEFVIVPLSLGNDEMQFFCLTEGYMGFIFEK